jgi:hypothetical protein
MPRPRKSETRTHQINFRFSTHEFVRVHAHASLSGKTVMDYGRSVLLRRPRRPKARNAPDVVSLPQRTLERWQVLGEELNAIAHLMNAREDLPPRELVQLRTLFKANFASVLDAGAPYSLSPPVRFHLRKVGTNLFQIRTRHDRLGIETPAALVRLLERVRTLMNGDQPPHGP